MEDLPEQSSHEGGGGSRRRSWLIAVLAGLVVVAGFVLFWFQPQKLFIDDRVDEALPTAAPTTTAADAAAADPPASPPTTSGPVELSRGEFVSLDHGTSGLARVLDLPDGRRIVRLEGLDTDNGPDLYLYLTTNPADGAEGAFDDDYVNLGRLKGNLGDQNYEVSTDADLARFRTVVIWCDRFDSAFGAADLAAA